MGRVHKSGKNDVWNEVFRRYADNIYGSIEENGRYDITSTTLSNISREIQGPDVRNLTKFDKSISLPDAFKKGFEHTTDFINIMPLGNIAGNYTFTLGQFNAYHELSYDETQKPTILPFPDVQVVTPNNIPSENAFIDISYTSGMLDTAFERKRGSLMPVLHGRMGSGPMNFNIGKSKIPIEVKGAQIEIDATFEDPSDVVIIEAKAVPEPDFIVRQLYYPYYVLKNRGVSKNIIPTFLVLLAGNYYFLKYKFSDPDNYSSIQLVEQQTFRFADETPITQRLIDEMYSSTNIVEEPKIPFPQADSFIQLTKILSIMVDGFNEDGSGMTFTEIAGNLGAKGYDPRQGSYYGNLLLYLDLAETRVADISHGKDLVPTEYGIEINRLLNTNEGRLALIRKLLSHYPFRVAYEFITRNNMQNAVRYNRDFKSQLAEHINEQGGIFNTKTKDFQVSLSTSIRRTQSIISLLNSMVFDSIG